MPESLVAFSSALWLGVLTSISPCPLATNIAAVTFLSRRIGHPFAVFLAGLTYTLGRMTAYAALGLLLIHSVLGVPQAAQFLQKYMGRALGPLLLLTGLVLLDLLPLRLPSLSLGQRRSEQLAGAGLPGAFLLGFLFALAFCPVSAALFFGSLLPLALNHPAGPSLPLVYGLGTGLPVLGFALAAAFGLSGLSLWFNRITALELHMRRVTGFVFLLAGAYYLWVYWAPIVFGG